MRNAILLSCLLTSCASPVVGVWPPAPGARTHRVTVALDAWHSVVGVWPGTDPEGVSEHDHIEWGYADRDFYLTRNDGMSGCCGALFWPTEGVIRVARAGLSIYDTRAEPARRWSFELSEEGYRRLIAFLKRERASGEIISDVGQSDWYSAEHSYQVFHHCNHWTTRALRTAGLPVWSFYSMFRWSFAMQMDRATSFVKKD